MTSTVVGPAPTPVPEAVTTWGLPVPLLTTVMAAVRAPVPPGVNATPNEQPAPAPTFAQLDWVTGNSKGLLLPTLATSTACRRC